MVRLLEARGQEIRVVGTFLEADFDGVAANLNDRRSIDEVGKQVPRFGPFVTVAETAREQAVSAARH